MSTEDKYAQIAALYDAMLPEDPERAAFFDHLFRSRNVRTVLDCACGTGNDLLLFHRLGYRVSGSDLSDSMLTITNDKLRKTHITVPIAKVDFQNLGIHYNERFDAVVCLSNAINEEDVDARAAIISMRSVLRSDGVIVFDQGQTDCSLQNPPLFAPIVNSKDLSRLYTMDYVNDIMTVHVFDFVHQEENSNYDFRHSEFRIRLRRYADWKTILESLSMEAQFYGSWKAEAYEIADSRRMIVVASNRQ